jgi:hypothetical protein
MIGDVAAEVGPGVPRSSRDTILPSQETPDASNSPIALLTLAVALAAPAVRPRADATPPGATTQAAPPGANPSTILWYLWPFVTREHRPAEVRRAGL